MPIGHRFRTRGGSHVGENRYRHAHCINRDHCRSRGLERLAQDWRRGEYEYLKEAHRYRIRARGEAGVTFFGGGHQVRKAEARSVQNWEFEAARLLGPRWQRASLRYERAQIRLQRLGTPLLTSTPCALHPYPHNSSGWDGAARRSSSWSPSPCAHHSRRCCRRCGFRERGVPATNARAPIATAGHRTGEAVR